MSFPTICKNATVIVDNRGSGVLFQPMTEEYTYVLTAKHNVENEDGSPISKEALNITSAIHDLIVIEKIYRHKDNNIDIAIVKIRKIECEEIFIQTEEPTIDERYKCYGYPDTRDNTVIHNLTLQVRDFSNSIIEFTNDDSSPIEEVSGFSGGGIFNFKENDGIVYLAGIEFGMDTYADETNNIVKAVFIKTLDKIIEDNSEELVPLYPPYMNDFNLLLDDIFLLKGLMIEKEKVMTFLRDIAKNDIRCNISPKEIYDLYKDKLLNKDEYTNELLNKELWIRYFEFLVLSKLIDTEEICIENIDKIYTKRKFLFAKTNNWTSLVKEIFSYDLKSLNKNGTLCIACDKDTKPDICEIPPELLKNINIVSSRRMNIKEGISNPIEEISIQHIHNFQRKLIQNQSVLSGLDIDKIEEKVKDEAKNTFRKNQ